MVAETRAAGIRNYSIFRHGLTLFGHFETYDLDHAIRLLTEGEANQRCDEYMTPIMKVEIDERTGFPFLLPLIWRMED